MTDNRRDSLRRAQTRFNARVSLEKWLQRYQDQLDSSVLDSVANAVRQLSPLASNSASERESRKAKADR